MTDEIKEINITFSGQILDYVDTKEHLLELFNYITNLQEENESLKEQNKNLKVKLKIRTKIGSYRKRKIDKAIEYIKNHTIEWVDEQFEAHNVMVDVDEYFNPEHLIWLLNGGDE